MNGASAIAITASPEQETPSAASDPLGGPVFPLTHAEFEGLMSAARPRLLRLARSFEVHADVVDDVVQETLLAAWRHRATLCDPSRFDDWIDSICRNICRMHLRARRKVRLGHRCDGERSPDAL